MLVKMCLNKACDCAIKKCYLIGRVTVLVKMQLNRTCDSASKKCDLIRCVTVLVNNLT